MEKSHEQYKRYSINRSYNKFLLWYEGTKNFKYGDDEYISKEYKEECRKYKVCKDAIYTFDNMLEGDEEHFHDERSVDFLRKVAKVEYVCRDDEEYIIKEEKEYVSCRNAEYADKNAIYAAIGLKGSDYISDVRIFDYLYFKYHMEYFLSTLREYHLGYKDVHKNEEDLSDTLEDLCGLYDDYIELYDDYYLLEHDYRELKKIRSHINLLRPRGLLSDEKTVLCVDYKPYKIYA